MSRSRILHFTFYFCLPFTRPAPNLRADAEIRAAALANAEVGSQNEELKCISRSHSAFLLFTSAFPLPALRPTYEQMLKSVQLR